MHPNRAAFLLLASAALLPALLPAQDVRPKDVREIGRGGSAALPRLQELLQNPNTSVRVEAVKQIAEIGTVRSLDPLIAATRDNQPEVQIQATDGMVNFYLPGYVQTGFGASLRRVGVSIKGKFTDTNDQVVDPFITVRADVIAALGSLVSSGGSMEARANAARALGVLRGQGAMPDLLKASTRKTPACCTNRWSPCRKSATNPPVRGSPSCSTISTRRYRLPPSKPPACCVTR